MRHIWGGDVALPNVSHCISENEVHYNPYVPHDYSQDYFTIVVKESGTEEYSSNVSFDYFSYPDYGKPETDWIAFKKNNDEWITLNWKSESPSLFVEVNSGDKIQFKGINDGVSGIFYSYGCTVDVEGNIMSLLYGDNFANKTSLEGQHSPFSSIFYHYDEFGYVSQKLAILDAKNLILPATTLVSSCYLSMFHNCTSLTTAPKLPATTLASNCYNDMFYGCRSLTTAPELPATTLANNCYSSMFQYCTGLTTAPELPATTLANNCYSYMFNSCTSLNYIKAMFTTTPSDDYTNSWVSGVASTGTFVKNSAATWNVTGVNGVPTGWTVETASA